MNLQPGDTVEFELMINAKGQPQASDPRPGGSSGHTTGTGHQNHETVNQAALTGRIVTIKEHYAFVQCEEVMSMYGKEVFVPSSLLHGLSVGDLIEFELMVNQKG